MNMGSVQIFPVLCFFNELSHVLNIESLRVVYFAHFQSLILYGLVSWGTPINLKRVFLLQRRIIWIILGLGPDAHADLGLKNWICYR
jgi:hypothetical protein